MNLREYLNQNFIREVSLKNDSPYLTSYSAYSITNKIPDLSSSQYFYLFLHLFTTPVVLETSKLFNEDIVIGVFIRDVNFIVNNVNNCPIDLLEFVNWHVKNLGIADFDIESAEIISANPGARNFPTALKIRTLRRSIFVSGDPCYDGKYILAIPKA